jgi:hypothetical protein
VKPDICTSLMCSSLGCDYCKQCSHAIFLGSAGKWKWRFEPRFGVEFLSKKDEPLKRQPGEKSPAWDEFEKWQKEKGL